MKKEEYRAYSSNHSLKHLKKWQVFFVGITRVIDGLISILTLGYKNPDYTETLILWYEYK